MITYFLKSATCLALLLAFYHFVLEKEKMHNFNRFYLLGSVLFSFVAPLYVIYIDVAPVVLETIQTTSEINLTDFTPIEIIEEKIINYTQIFIGVYILISFVLLMRFGKNIFNIISKIRRNTKVKYQNAKLVLVDDNILPHTFWNYIFINKNDYENQKIEQELFTHELTHVTQKHTLDVLILEVIQIIFWVNPFFILLKKAVQLNHEFLADETVIDQHKNTFQYQHILVNKAAWKNEYYLASNLNYSLTKKRLLMMTTQSSRTKILLKKLAVIPLLASFIFLFAERVEAQEKVKEGLETIYEQEPSKQKSLTDSEIYKEYVNRNGFSIINDKSGKKIKKKFSELTDEEKKKLPPPPPLKSKKKVPTKKLIEDLKDIKKYALWIDGKVMKNEILNNYRATDFSGYFVSFVHKNARSKRFPQNYQAHLSTHKYFKAQNKKRVNNFKKYLEEKYEVEETDKERNDEFREIINEIGAKYDNSSYKKLNKFYESKRNQKPHFIKSSKERQRQLKERFSELGSLYFKLSKDDKKKTKRPILPHHPYLKLMRNNKVFYKLRNELTEEDNLLIPPPPPNPNASKKDILKAKKAYKAWKKRTGNDFAPAPKQQIKKNEKEELARTNKLKLAFKKSLPKILDKKPIAARRKMNMSDIETVKYLKNEKAGFIYNNKAITGKNAIKLFSQNKKLRMYYIETKDKPTLVYISDKKNLLQKILSLFM